MFGAVSFFLPFHHVIKHFTHVVTTKTLRFHLLFEKKDESVLHHV